MGFVIELDLYSTVAIVLSTDMRNEINAQIVLIAVIRELRPQPDLIIDAAIKRADKKELLDKALHHCALVAFAGAGSAKLRKDFVKSVHRCNLCFC